MAVTTMDPAVRALLSDILTTMAAELGSNSSLDHLQVFAAVVHDLASLADLPLPPLPADDDLRETLSNRLAMLLVFSRMRVDHIPFHLVSAGTLRAYTDAAILQAVQHFVEAPMPERERGRKTRWTEIVQVLDRTIIVAGAVGERRLEWVHALIRALQPESKLPIETAPEPESKPEVKPDIEPRGSTRGVKRRRSASEGRPLPHPSPADVAPSPPLASFQPLFAPNPIPTPTAPPALGTSPFIIRNYLSSGVHHPPWPAVSHWSSAPYLLRATGRARIVPVECGRAYDEQGWTQKIVSWEGFLRAGWDMAAVPPPSPEEDQGGDEGRGGREGCGIWKAADDIDGLDPHTPLYLAQTSLFRQFPALERDIAMPDYVYSALPDDYSAPEEPLVNVWIGPGGQEVVSPAHTDPYYNCYAQVLGSKRVWLAPPDCGPHMYAYAEEEPDEPDAPDAPGAPGAPGGPGLHGAPDAPGNNADDPKSAHGAPSNAPRNLHDAPPSSQPSSSSSPSFPPLSLSPTSPPESPPQHNANQSAMTEYMTNTSRVPLLRPAHDHAFTSLQPDFPDFFEHVYPRAMEAVLDPGDLLVMPPGWWHAMRGEGGAPCWSVSFWF